MTDIGYRTHAMHETPPRAKDEAREVLAILFEPQFPVEAEMVRKGLHFMLPASWAVEAVQSALDCDEKRESQPVAWLREVDAGADNACLVVAARGDEGAFPVFAPVN